VIEGRRPIKTAGVNTGNTRRGAALGQMQTIHDEHLYVELWVSFASLLRSYTAAHGLNGNRQATVELGETKIIVRHAEKWLTLDRSGAHIAWTRENGSVGTLEFTHEGRLRTADLQGAGTTEEELDMVAEAWARELML
jgi:hypothetical protein